MKTIHKYPLTFSRDIRIEMPLHAQVLTVQNQYGKPMLWAMVETGWPMRTRYFECHATGIDSQEHCGQLRYINTVQFKLIRINADYTASPNTEVYHFFERVTNEY
jgi:hypothetical protein